MLNNSLPNRKLIHIDRRRFKFNQVQKNKTLRVILINIKRVNRETLCFKITWMIKMILNINKKVKMQEIWLINQIFNKN
jgi:hypothetical protein